MKIPKTLKILGHQVNIVGINDLEKRNGLAATGACYFTENRIWVDSSRPTQQQEATLIHEIIEYLNAAMELDLKHNVICSLESGLYQVLKDNNLLK